jgi:PAS domain S-box-containing protein
MKFGVVANHFLETQKLSVIKANTKSILECITMSKKTSYGELERRVKELERDAVNHKQAEELLRRSEATLNATQQLAKIGGWEIDLENKITYWTDEVYQIHDLLPNRFTSFEKKDVDQTHHLKPDEFTSVDEAVKLSAECYDPLDRKKLMDAFQKCVENAQSYDMELPFTTVKGHQKWTRTTANPVMEGDKVIKITGLLADITKRKHVEDALLESEQKYRILIENLPQKINYRNRNSEFVTCNVNFADEFKISPEEVIGKTDFDFYPKELAQKYCIDDKRIMLSGGTEEIVEEHIQCGKKIIVQSVKTAVFNDKGTVVGLLCIYWDITERKLMEETLTSSQQKLLLHIEQTPLAVIDWNPLFVVTEWNPAAENIFGFTKKEAMGQHAAGLVVPDSAKAQVDEVWSALLKQKGGKRSTNKNITKKGEIIYCEWYNTPLIDEKGAVIGITSLAQDITERIQAEEALRKAHNELESKVVERTAMLQQEIDERKQIEYSLLEARKEAEIANQSKSEFLSNISHELRSPMHQILSFAKFGVDKIDKIKKEKLLHYFSKIGTIGKNLLSLLNDLLDLSKLESGKLDYDMLQIDLKQIIINVSNEFDSLIYEKGVVIEIEESNILTEIVCDEYKIGQVIRNLLSNAIKFTPKGKKITISIKYSELAIEQRKTDQKSVPALSITVSDQGVGIPNDELDSVFDKFVQSSITKTGAGGTGLGLAICKKIINAHNGKIRAENNPEDGSTFCFMLPYEQEIN